MKEKRTDTQNFALLAYLAVCIIWGSTFLAIRIAVQDLPPMLSTGIRFTLVGLLMFGFSYWKRRPLPTKDQIYHQSIVGLFLLLGGNGLVVIGSQWVHSSIASLLFATTPLFIAIEEFILTGGEKLTWRGWLGLTIGFSGVALLVLTGQRDLGFSIKGISIILIGAISWASGSTYSRRIKSGGAMMVNLGIQAMAAGIGFLIISFLLGETGHITISLKGVLAILYLVIFGSLLGYNSYIYLLSVWPAAKVSTYAYVNPFVAIFLGHLILNEPITVFVFLGTAIILIGVFLVQFSHVKKTEPIEQVTT